MRHRRHRRRWYVVAVAALSVATGAVVPSGTAAKTVPWRVSGTLTGSYANTHGWVNCTDTGAAARFAEAATVNTKLSPRTTARFDPAGASFIALGRVTVSGKWSQTGAFPRRRPIPGTSDEVCGPPENIACSGALEALRSDKQSGDLLLFKRGSVLTGRMRAVPRIVESSLAGKSSGADICSDNATPGSSFGLFYGVATTDMVSRAWGADFRIPAARLTARKTFTVIGKAAGPDPDGCDGTWDPCTQSGKFVFKLTFTPG